MSVLSKPYFHSEEAAFTYLESIVWSDGAVCPHCGGVDRITKVKANPEKRIRVGLWRCGDCKRQFTVKIGTVFEHMRLPLHKALQAVYLMTSSKKGISAHQLHRVLEITYKSAWFLAHRIREAMRDGDLAPFGGNGGEVLADETWIGNKPGVPKGKGGFRHKFKVVALLDKQTGRTRAVHAAEMVPNEVANIVRANVDRESILVTDEARHYWKVGKEFADHRRVFHGIGNYSKDGFSTNQIEGYFSIFKRGMRGVYQHCNEKHLHRYLAEFDFRYSNREAVGCNDADRSVAALSGIVGKRLTYQTTGRNV